MTDQDIQKNEVSAEKPEDEDEDDSFADNYAMAIALGLPAGLLIGLLVFDNIALGSLVGLAFAPVIAIFMKNRKSEE